MRWGERKIDPNQLEEWEFPMSFDKVGLNGARHAFSFQAAGICDRRDTFYVAGVRN